jgi:aconitate hydratase
VGQQAFDTFKVVPPGIGIVHQVNLEYLAKGVLNKGGVYYPDTLVGTDSHTTMINGIGVVGWGVGGIEAEAGMLGQPVYLPRPRSRRRLPHRCSAKGVTATDLVLRVTEMLRKHGSSASSSSSSARRHRLPVPDRATIANMAPEYGATMGFFPVDEETINYLRGTGRSEKLCTTVRGLLQGAGPFGASPTRASRLHQVLELDLATVVPSVAGPKRPQDRIDVPVLGEEFNALLTAPAASAWLRHRRGEARPDDRSAGGAPRFVAAE